MDGISISVTGSPGGSTQFAALNTISFLHAHKAPVPEPVEEPLPGEHPVPQEDPVPSPNPEVKDPAGS